MSTQPAAFASMFDPQGQIRQVPQAQLQDALQSGGKYAVRVTDPQGITRYIPHDMVQQAIHAGGKVAQDEPLQAHPAANQPGFWGSLGRTLLGTFSSIGPTLNPMEAATRSAEAGVQGYWSFQKAAEENRLAKEAEAAGRHGEAAIHSAGAAGYGLTGVLAPVGGGALESAGEKIGTPGQRAAGFGETAGLLAPVAAAHLLPVPKAETTPAIPGVEPTGRIRSTVRQYMGIGPRAAERTVTKTMAEHAEAVGKVQEANKAAQAKYQQAAVKTAQKQAQIVAETEQANKLAQQEHAEATANVEKLNQAGQEAVGKRADLSRQIESNSSALGETIRDMEKQVRTIGNGKYQAVEQATAGDTVPADTLASAVRHAEKNIIQGSPESIKQFRDLLAKGEPSDVATSVGTATPGTPLYDALVQSGAIEPTQQMGFRDLQGYYTELGQKMMQPSVPGDVYRALRSVRDAVGKEMEAMAERHGAGEQLADARRYWKQYEQTFHDMRPVSQGGSPVARAFRAQDPGYVAAPLLGKASARAVSMLSAYSKEAGGSAAALARDFEQMRSLPKTFKPKEAPAAPEVKQPKVLETPQPPKMQAVPEPPDVGKAIQEAREKRIGQISGTLRSVSGWDIASISGGLYQIARGEWPTAFSLTVVRHGIGRILDNPSVIEWLAKPTQEDFAQLQKLPTAQRSEVQNAITSVYLKQAQAGKPVKLPPAARAFLTPEQNASLDQATQRGGMERRATPRPSQADMQAYYTDRLQSMRRDLREAQQAGDQESSAALTRLIDQTKQLAHENATQTAPRMPAAGPQRPSGASVAPQAAPRPAARVQPPVGPSAVRQATLIMLAAKQGQITSQEADRQIQKLVGSGGRRTIRRPSPPE